MGLIIPKKQLLSLKSALSYSFIFYQLETGNWIRFGIWILRFFRLFFVNKSRDVAKLPKNSNGRKSEAIFYENEIWKSIEN